MGTFELKGVVTAVQDEAGGELKVTLASGIDLWLRVAHTAVSGKLLRKWMHAISKHSPSGDAVVIGGHSAEHEEQQQCERDLGQAAEECGFARCLADVTEVQHKAAASLAEQLEHRIGELRGAVEAQRKKSVTALTPQRKPGKPEFSARHQGCDVALLVAALRVKGATAEQTAKHIYSAMGHRPHEEEAAMQAMSPASVSLIDSLPKVTAQQRIDQLMHFLAKDDPFAMQVLREYASMFLRLKGLDLDLALRRLLYHFKLPKESQQIGRVLRAFAETYLQHHVGLTAYDHASSAFAPVTADPNQHYGPGEFLAWTDAESVELIAFALVMLNGDLHNPENTEKMTKQQFVDNIKRSGATVVLSEQVLVDLYMRIHNDPMSFDNKLSPYPEAVRKAYVDCKVSGVPGLRLWTRVWAVLCENYDVTCLANAEERNQRSGGFGVLFLCKSSREESTVLLTFPVKRTVALQESAKREFSVTQSHVTGTVAAAPATASTLRSVMLGGNSSGEQTKVKFRCKTDGDYSHWIRTFQYLLSGGYGFWYPGEHRDFDLDLPDGHKKTRRRRKGAAGTLKKKKPASSTSTDSAVRSNSPRNNEIDVHSSESGA